MAKTAGDLEALSQHLACYRYNSANEDDLQRGLASVLDRAGIAHEREHALAPGCRVDFFIHGIALECKIRCSQAALLHQVHRYAELDVVEAVLLFTPSLRLRLPHTLCGKPVAVCRVPQL